MTTTDLGALERRVRDALVAVPDPEIPTCSIVDLGMVERIEVGVDSVDVDLLPTFVGCPAKDVIGRDVERAVVAVAGDRAVRVRFVYDPPWTTERITAAGRAGLRKLGITPHWENAAATGAPVAVPLLRRAGVGCPYCGSTDTVLDAPFGPTPCRTTHFCRACRNPFEGFKEKEPRCPPASTTR
ncbi:MAG TPA: 1,2-phenylacetyl-CoA epoxidase subunit PaaD [Actinomycetota bacterium]|nr:1,2-phenylacetyl-CoA epoxidase subunit PaaD [Actinomycetota bacterium]